jgi:hypothetical protein
MYNVFFDHYFKVSCTVFKRGIVLKLLMFDLFNMFYHKVLQSVCQIYSSTGFWYPSSSRRVSSIIHCQGLAYPTSKWSIIYNFIVVCSTRIGRGIYISFTWLDLDRYSSRVSSKRLTDLWHAQLIFNPYSWYQEFRFLDIKNSNSWYQEINLLISRNRIAYIKNSISWYRVNFISWYQEF